MAPPHEDVYLALLDEIKQGVATANRNTAELAQNVALLNQKLEEVIPLVQEHKRILRSSNGDIGMVAMMTALARTVEQDHNLLHGDNDDPGLKEQVRQMMRSAGWFGKLAWIIISAVVGTSAGALVSLLLK